MGASSLIHPAATTDALLQVYLLGSVDFDEGLRLQRRLAYEVAGDRGTAALVLCEHPPVVSIGREGSWSQLLWEPGTSRLPRWPVRWVNRGGGCILHLPGQLAVYPILALDHWQLGVRNYQEKLRAVLLAMLNEFSLADSVAMDARQIRVGPRTIAEIGVAVRDWVAYYGAVVNVNPNLSLYRQVLASGNHGLVTSLERERRGRLKPALVRERLLEHFVSHFGFKQTALFFDHPALRRKAPADAIATHS
jgi:lipoyl(octanoyl) transferase